MGSQPDTVTQISKVELPEWVELASEENYQLAKKLGSQPMDRWKGDRVADATPMMQQAYKTLNKSGAAGQQGYRDADDIFNRMSNSANSFSAPKIDPAIIKDTQDVRAKMLTDMDLSKYLNPYIDAVEKTSLDALDRQRQQGIMSNASAATAAGAFGGGRHGVVDALTNSEAALGAGQLSAQLRQQGYDRATGLATSDIDRLLAAETGNADRDFSRMAANQASRNAARTNNAANLLDTFNSKNNVRSTAAQGLMSSAQGKQDARLRQFAALMQSGQTQQAQKQREIDQKIDNYDAKKNYDIENLNMRLSALGMSPYGKTESTTKTAESGTDWGTMGLGIMSLFMGLSEDDTKTDIEKVGKLPNTDLDVFAYRYKKDPKTYPKVVGIMASDVEKKMPDAVSKIGKKRVVNYGLIEERMNG